MGSISNFIEGKSLSRHTGQDINVPFMLWYLIRLNIVIPARDY